MDEFWSVLAKYWITMFLTSMLWDRVYSRHDLPLLSRSCGLAPFSSKVWMSLSFWCLWHSFVSIPHAAIRTVIFSSFRSLTFAPPSARIRPRRNFPSETAFIRLQEDMFDRQVTDWYWSADCVCVLYVERRLSAIGYVICKDAIDIYYHIKIYH